MKKSIPAPVAIAIVVVVLLIGGFYGWHAATANGEVPNPNAGHPSKTPFKLLSRKEADNMSIDNYIQLLKQTRPELTDDQRQALAENWWKVKTGQAKPQQ